jgi:hypothetical protein
VGGIGHYIPLDKEGKKILELGVVGYDQWQVTANGGTLAPSIPKQGSLLLVPRHWRADQLHHPGTRIEFLV